MEKYKNKKFLKPDIRILEGLKNIEWEKIMGRKADIQKAMQFAYGIGYGFKDFFKTKEIKYQLIYFDGHTTRMYFSKKELKEFMASINSKLNNAAFLKNFEQKAAKVFKQSLIGGKEAIKNLKSKNKDLYSLLIDFNTVWNGFYPMGWFFFFLGDLEKTIKKSLSQIHEVKITPEECMRIIASPKNNTPLASAEIDILKLATMIRRKSKQVPIIAKEMSGEYGWMSVYNFDDEPRNSDFYIIEAEKLAKSTINLKSKIEKIKKAKLSNEKKYNTILKQIKSGLLKEQIKLLHIAGFLRDYREEVRDRLSLMAGALYRAIAEEVGLSLKEVIDLTNGEIKEILEYKRKKNYFRKIAESRQKRFLFIIKGEKYALINNQKELKKILKSIEHQEQSVICGQVVSSFKGVIRGKVKVVLNNKEINKVQTGDILVATMTKPDYLSAMKKAAVFITDEGGITCHAAIVAREINKPCIIGTKIATQVLKDGDLVEVDAELGVVKILKNK